MQAGAQIWTKHTKYKYSIRQVQQHQFLELLSSVIHLREHREGVEEGPPVNNNADTHFLCLTSSHAGCLEKRSWHCSQALLRETKHEATAA